MKEIKPVVTEKHHSRTDMKNFKKHFPGKSGHDFEAKVIMKSVSVEFSSAELIRAIEGLLEDFKPVDTGNNLN